MTINYIYSATGQVEYAIIPINLWEILKPYLQTEWVKQPVKPAFDPRKYKGMIRHLKLDIEQELKTMRNEWTRNF